MKKVTKEILTKALTMRRDFTIQEIAELLEVRAEELIEALDKFVKGEDPLPPVAETTRVKPDAKPKAKSKTKKKEKKE